MVLSNNFSNWLTQNIAKFIGRIKMRVELEINAFTKNSLQK